MFVAVALDGWLLVVVIGCLDWLCVYGCCGLDAWLGCDSVGVDRPYASLWFCW